MKDKAVTLLVRYKDAEGKWRRSPAARANGRVRPGYVLADGNQIRVDSASYELRSYEGRQAKYTAAGKNAAAADSLCKRTQRQQTIRAEAAKVGVQVYEGPDRKSIAIAAAEYIEDCDARGVSEAAVQARNVTERFLQVVKKSFVDEITREDILRFHAAIRKDGNKDRTIANKHLRLTAWLRFAGVSKDVFHHLPRTRRNCQRSTLGHSLGASSELPIRTCF